MIFLKSQPFSRKKLKTADFFRYACYRADVLTTGMGWIRRMVLIMMCYCYSYLRAYEVGTYRTYGTWICSEREKEKSCNFVA